MKLGHRTYEAGMGIEEGDLCFISDEGKVYVYGRSVTKIIKKVHKQIKEATMPQHTRREKAKNVRILKAVKQDIRRGGKGASKKRKR